MRDPLSKAGKLAAHLPGLLLRAERVAHTFMKGGHGRRRTGQGEAFWQFRPWSPGDSVRDVDWKQTARRDRVHIRQREWEAAQTVWLYRDATPSMDFRSRQGLPAKREYAEVLLLALAMILLEGGEQVGLLGSGLAPQSHPGAAARLFDALPGQTVLAEGGRPVAARSQAVLFSDFFFPPEELEAFCESLSRRGAQGTLVQVCDPAEETLPYSGRVRFHDSENAAESLTVPQAAALRGAYVEKFSAHRRRLSEIAGARGWRFHAFSTAAPYERALAALYDGMGAA